MNLHEIDALVANEIKQLGLEGTLNTETIEKIKQSVLEKIENENKLVENQEVNISLENNPSEPTEVVVSQETQPYQAELPSFIDKIEPAKFIVFDRNELSVGGENLSNKPFRLLGNPDTKKSVHQTWIEDGKKKAEVYIAKFVKIGEIEFNYANGQSNYIEQKEEKPETNQFGLEQNPHSDDFKPVVIVDEEEGVLENEIKKDIDVENKLKEYIDQLIKDNFNSSSVNKISPEKVHESLKMREIVMNEKVFEKIDTPEKLKQSIKEGKGEAKMISKNDQVQVWMLEGKEYIFPSEIISSNKCYSKKLL